MNPKSFHLVLHSDNKGTISNALGAVIQDNFPENSLLMVSCSKSSDQYRATVDLEE
jgi:hypothetical protein